MKCILSTASQDCRDTRVGNDRLRLIGAAINVILPFTIALLAAGCGGGYDNLPGPPASIEIVMGAGQSTQVGSAFSTPLMVIVRDRNENLVEGAHVTFTVAGAKPAATFESIGVSATIKTNSSGLASSPALRAGKAIGNLVVIASLADDNSPVRFPLTILSGPVSRVSIETGSGQSTKVGTDFPVALSVRVYDQFGNPVSGAQVQFASPHSGPGATFDSNERAAVQTDINGIALSPPVLATTLAGAYNVVAICGALSATFSLTNTPGPLEKLVTLAGQDQSTPVATKFPTAVIVKAEDVYDNGLPNELVAFALQQTGGNGEFQTGGSTATASSDQNGLVTSPAIMAGTTAGSVSVIASAGNLSTNLQLSVAPGPAARLNPVGGDDQEAIFAAPFASPLRAKVVDQYGNGVEGVPVTFATPLVGPSGTFAGEAHSIVVSSGDNGVATAPELYAGSTVGSFVALASSGSVASDASFALSNTSNGVDDITISDAERFLTQIGFGPTTAEVAKVRAMGFRGYLADQFNAPVFQFPVLSGENIPAIQTPFFQDAVSGADQFRERVTLALSDIFSVSPFTGQPPPAGKASLLNILQRDAFGSFSSLLTDVTLSPAMGAYLSIAGNRKADPSAGTRPNENYARELMQLFTIGLVRLNQDGSVAQGQDGGALSTYDQTDVEANAAILTGWNYVLDQNGAVDLTASMQADESAHDEGPKTIIDGVHIPAGGTADQELSTLLQTLVDDPNTGPFICKQLIQHMVSSNPSRQYVARISSVFNDDGSGARGDMKAVLTAIVLDPEARETPAPDAGHFMEPMLYLATILHELGATTDGVAPADASIQLGQNPFVPPSVFGFYAPSHAIVQDGKDLLAPEFSLETFSADIARQRFVRQLLLGQLAPGTVVDLSGLSSTAAEGSGPLLDQLDSMLTLASMPISMKEAISTALDQMSGTSTLERVRAAVEIVATSPWFLIAH